MIKRLTMSEVSALAERYPGMLAACRELAAARQVDFNNVQFAAFVKRYQSGSIRQAENRLKVMTPSERLEFMRQIGF